ncbi:LysM peptidoglycan-binding domain-containing protein [Ramlibacter sp. AN1133]|uniref:LysM peptidoglycan-binding domain-containing protein n=1 Tax=Ramlibacter sp. AN1133 TaxID=3133429 RepID=UPI0030C44B07
MKIYRAKLKSKRAMERDIPRERWGWWHDVCPGQTLTLRDATAADLERCILGDHASKDPADYLCETFEGGCLVSREAVGHLGELPQVPASQLGWHGPAHITDSGESLCGIALRQLGDERRWTEIRDLNADRFPDMLGADYYPVGTVLRMPVQRPRDHATHPDGMEMPRETQVDCRNHSEVPHA